MENAGLQEFESEQKQLLEAIQVKTGYDFRNYSEASVKRRLVQAMSQMGCKTLSALQEKVLRDGKGFDDLLQFLTVPVSEMFRDPSYFLALRQNVMPILQTYPSIKVWVAGCSTGEEVYSLAILLQEEDLLDRTILYATDINPRSLEAAERGVYAVDRIQKFTHGYQLSGGKRSLSDYYTAAFDSVKFDKSLLKNITFANHSLVTDSVFSETHLISCRNVLIYFNRELQNRVFELFKESLCRKGFLGIGSKETLRFSQEEKYFSTFENAERIYQKL